MHTVFARYVHIEFKNDKWPVLLETRGYNSQLCYLELAIHIILLNLGSKFHDW